MASSSSSSHVNLGLVDDVIASSKPLYAPLSRVGNRIAISDNHSIPFDEQDHSVYYDRTSNAWRCEVPDNIRERGDPSELEWNGVQRKWLPVVDDSLIEAQQAAYSVPGVDESTPAAPVLRREGKRRRQDGDQNGDKKQRRRVNASIYVTGLPLDCTKEEIAKTFSRYGVLNEDDAGQPRIKMYTDEESGLFRGDALVTYFREESVELAINVLDESALRAADGKASPIMHLTRAEFGAKTDQANGNGKDQEQDKGAKQAKAAMSDADKKRLQRRFAKMNDKLNDWNSDTDDEQGADPSSSVKGLAVAAGRDADVRQVCLRRMFTIAELEEDPTLLLDLKEDVREECETLGTVTNLVLWDKEPDGIMTIRFADSQSASACVERMNGRFFAGRRIQAHLLSGKPRFRRSDREDGGDEEQDRAREDAFGTWLEGEAAEEDGG